MKLQTILLGAAAVGVAYVVYQKYVAKQPASPLDTIKIGAGQLWDAGRGLVDGVLSLGGKPATPSSGPAAATDSSGVDATTSARRAPSLGGLDIGRSAYNVRVPNLGFGRAPL